MYFFHRIIHFLFLPALAKLRMILPGILGSEKLHRCADGITLFSPCRRWYRSSIYCGAVALGPGLGLSFSPKTFSILLSIFLLKVTNSEAISQLTHNMTNVTNTKYNRVLTSIVLTGLKTRWLLCDKTRWKIYVMTVKVRRKLASQIWAGPRHSVVAGGSKDLSLMITQRREIPQRGNWLRPYRLRRHCRWQIYACQLPKIEEKFSQ